MAFPVLNRAVVAGTWLTTVFVVLLSGTAVFAQSSLTPHSAEYKIRISVLGGELTTELRATESGYVATHIVRPTGITKIVANGSIEETSEFEISADGVRPIHYLSVDALSRDKQRAEVDFNWNTSTVSGTIDDEVIDMALDGRAHDRVSIQYELMRNLMNDLGVASARAENDVHLVLAQQLAGRRLWHIELAHDGATGHPLEPFGELFDGPGLAHQVGPARASGQRHHFGSRCVGIDERLFCTAGVRG